MIKNRIWRGDEFKKIEGVDDEHLPKNTNLKRIFS